MTTPPIQGGTTMRRALLGIDGNCAFAGIGHLAEAPQHEWVFVEIKGDPEVEDNWRPAIAEAYCTLRKNVAPEVISYALDESHPRFV